MQRLFILLFLATLHSPVFSQHVYKIKTDSLLVTNDTCSAEFILENESKYVKGFLYNKGKGRTIFQQAMIKLNDSMYVFGNDTLNFRSLLNTIGFSGSNIYNTDGTLTGNRVITSNGYGLTLTGDLTVGSGSNASMATNATNFYVDGRTTGAGNYTFRNWSNIIFGSPITAGQISAWGINVGSNNTVVSVAGTGVTRFSIGNTTSSSTWHFENHRNAPSGSLEISNSIDTPGLVLFPNRNMSIGSYTNNGYKLDVNGTGRFSNSIYYSTSIVPQNISTYGVGIGLESGSNYIGYIKMHGQQTDPKIAMNWWGVGVTNITTPAVSLFNNQALFTISSKDDFASPLIAGGTETGGYKFFLMKDGTAKFSSITGTGDGNYVGYPLYISSGDAILKADAMGTNLFLRSGLSYGDGTVAWTANRTLYNSSLVFQTSAATGTSGSSTANNYVTRMYIDGNTGKTAIGASTPTSMLDVQGTTGHSQFRLRTSYTPTSTSDTNGNTGDFSWDDNYFYIKTSTGWKRSALTSF